ncbi:hypothetical protein BDW22DRAFT_915961 [Trametopsis cervina]|nr:hypothetical protein BDW22DRAFT_915961 [Trametopsis cervina]
MFSLLQHSTSSSDCMQAEKAVAAVSVISVQLFYAFRVWKITKNSAVITGSIILLSLGSFSFNVVSTVQLHSRQFIAELLTPEITVFMGLTSGLAIACDILIMASQVYFLRPSKWPDIRRPKPWLLRTVHLLSSRGTSFTLMHIALLIALLSDPESQIWILLHFIITKVYINNLYTMLNTRQSFGGRGLYEEEKVPEPQKPSFTSLAFVTPDETGFDINDDYSVTGPTFATNSMFSCRSIDTSVTDSESQREARESRNLDADASDTSTALMLPADKGTSMSEHSGTSSTPLSPT